MRVTGQAGGSGALDVRIDRKSFSDVGSGMDRVVLEDIRFAIRAGEFVALVGPSGCGKTTLLHIVAGLDRDYEGDIRWPDAGRGGAQRLGYMFQNPRLLPWLSVRANIALVLADPARHGDRIDAMIRAMGLEEFSHFHPNRLSVGMQRRAALARAFVVEPRLLVMDEPFVSLDLPTANQLRQLLLKVWDANRSTVIVVTHDLYEATTLADRILFLSTSPARIIGEVDVGLSRGRRTIETSVNDRYLDLKRLFDALYGADRSQI
jgi:ABC-type nitrate/sulfonate/bicarbonate transport system ATPase subunit